MTNFMTIMPHAFKPVFMTAPLLSSVLIGLSLVEAVVLGWRARRGGAPFAWYETWLSLVDMAGRHVAGLAPLTLAAPVFALAWRYRLCTVSLHGAPALALLFVGQEFCYYWYHRAAHRVRFFWASHAVHHSPNQLTLSTAYRLGWTTKLTGSGLFFAPLVWLGFRPHNVMAVLSLNLLYRFWIHNTWTPRLGWLEYVFNTPSAHRVHHASNAGYLDANYGGVLIVFDRLFGTWVAERAERPCRYGLVTPVRSRNPFAVEFGAWASLARDLAAASSLPVALGHLLRPPGWRAEGGAAAAGRFRRDMG